ncbi:MAG: MarR family transcriptional regulator [Alphaproteobacteria bacterium HGW-Alphaproteobacteria-6]|nr:MAG: MarR family transcriptional regulator [Alphaproteobacteria bacterium HGW-Alphaproteobacteria-6]
MPPACQSPRALARPVRPGYRGRVKSDGYSLDDQIGFVLRRATQRHLAIFSEAIPGLTTRQFAALARLAASGPLSQNQLGRAAAMDAATIKGVVDRLRSQGLVATAADPGDGRRLVVRLTGQGQALFDATRAAALEVSERTLAPLDKAERAALLALLARLA